MAQLRPPGNANLDGKVAQSGTDALRVCAVYPCALTPRAEYLALTLCKPSGGLVKYTTPTPPHRSRPVDLRHWTPPRSLSGVGNPSGDGIGPESRHFIRARMGCPRRRCSARMLQGAETLNRTPEGWRGMIIMMMTTLMVMVTNQPVPVNDNFHEIECALLLCGLLKGSIKHAKQAVSR